MNKAFFSFVSFVIFSFQSFLFSVATDNNQTGLIYIGGELQSIETPTILSYLQRASSVSVQIEEAQNSSMTARHQVQPSSRSISFQKLVTYDLDKKSKQKFSQKGSVDFGYYLQKNHQYFMAKQHDALFRYGISIDFPYADFEDYALKQFNYYQFEGFRNFVKTLPHFESVVYQVNYLLWEAPDAKKTRENLKGKCGFKKWGFQALFEDLKKEIETNSERQLAKLENEKREAQNAAAAEQERIRNELRQRKQEWLQQQVPLYFEENITQNLINQSERIQNYKEIILDYDQEDLLVGLAKKYIEKLKPESGQEEEQQLYRERIDAIVQTLQNPNTILEQHYLLANHTEAYLKHYNVDLDRVLLSYGNVLQQNIHKEVVGVIENASNMLYGFSGVGNTSNLAELVFHSSNIAFDLKDSCEYERAYSMIDIAKGAYIFGKQAIFAAAKGISEFSSDVKEMCDRVTSISSKEELCNGLINIVQGLYVLLRTSPLAVDYMLEKAGHCPGAADLFPNYIDYHVMKLHCGERNLPFPEFGEWKKGFKNQISTKAFWEKLKGDPEQVVLDGITASTKFLFLCGLCGVATDKVVALTNASLATVANELRLCADNIRRAQDAANGIIEAKVVEIQELPFFSALQSTEEAVHLATVEGVKVTENALNIVKNNPALAVAEGSVAGAAKEVVRQTKKVVGGNGASNIDTEYVVKSAILPRTNGESIVGHSFQKHASRHPGIWGKVTGSCEQKHLAALKHLQEIINAPGGFVPKTNGRGICFLEKKLPDGRGVRLNMNQNFKGFID